MGFPFDFGFEGSRVELGDAKLGLFFVTTGDVGSLGRVPGAAALADASRYVEFFDMQGELNALGIGVYAELSGPGDPIEATLERVREAESRGVFSIVIADDRTVVPKYYECPLVALWGKLGRSEREESLLSMEKGTCLVGVRAATKEAFHKLSDQATIVTSESIYRDRTVLDGVVETLKEPVHLSIDYDVLAPGVVEGARSLEPGGFSWYELMLVLEKLFFGPGVRSAQIVGTENIPAKTPAALLGAQLLTKIAGLIGSTGRQ